MEVSKDSEPPTSHLPAPLTFKTMLRRALARLVWPVVETVASRLEVEDPWERLDVRVPPGQFGPGSKRGFDWYLEGPSQVAVTSVSDVCEWLVGCEYVDDMVLFRERDYWQHPSTFEQLRRGDCEDHALWAWRKLVELKVDAEFVSGRWDVTKPDPGGHAWIVYRDSGGQSFVLETVTKSVGAMIQPLEEVRSQYVPHTAVSGSQKTVAFAGFLLELRRRRADRKTRGKPGAA